MIFFVVSKHILARVRPFLLYWISKSFTSGIVGHYERYLIDSVIPFCYSQCRHRPNFGFIFIYGAENDDLWCFWPFSFLPKNAFFSFVFFSFSAQNMLFSATNGLSNVPKVADI